jgi:hypothetical protein
MLPWPQEMAVRVRLRVPVPIDQDRALSSGFGRPPGFHT